MPNDPSGRPKATLIETLGGGEGVLKLGDVRAVIMTESAFVFLQRVIHESMPELVKYGFYEMGYRAGIDLSTAARRAGDDPEVAFRAAVSAYREAGYGDIEVRELNLEKPEARLVGHELLEVSAARMSGIHRTPRCVDHYSRGILAGLFSQVLGKQVICEEIRCEYRGDPCCEFMILGYAPTE